MKNGNSFGLELINSFNSSGSLLPSLNTLSKSSSDDNSSSAKRLSADEIRLTIKLTGLSNVSL